MQKVVLSLVFIILIISAGRFNHRATDGFRVHKVCSNLSYNPDWNCSNYVESSEIENYLNKPFTYLGSGGQCYAFLSSDGKTVLKLFKHHHMRLSSFWRSAHLGPLEKFRLKVFGNANEKLNQVFNSFLIAKEKLQSSSGLIYLHLNKSADLRQKITLIGPLGVKHTLDADTLEFALQHYAVGFYDQLDKLLNTGQEEQARKIVGQLLELIERKKCLGIIDNDPILKKNFGYSEGEVIQIDCGSFLAEAPADQCALFQEKATMQLKFLADWLSNRNLHIED